MRKKNFLLAVSIALVLTGCGNLKNDIYSSVASNKEMADMAEGGYYNEDSYAESNDYEEASLTEEGGNVEVGENAAATSRKLIRNISLSVETTEYDTLIANIKNQVSALNGYIEQIDSSVHTWDTPQTHYTNMTIRVPAQNADELVGMVDADANITNRNENLEDVTLSYVDMESHKKALIAEQDRLLEIMKQAESVEDIITIESRLSEVRYQIESMEAQLRTYDNKINYTTIRLNISEVKKLTPVEEKGYFAKIFEGFTDSLVGVLNGLLDFISWLIIKSPYLVVWFVILMLIYKLVIKAIIRKHMRAAKERKNARLNKVQADNNAAKEAEKAEEELTAENTEAEDESGAAEESGTEATEASAESNS